MNKDSVTDYLSYILFRALGPFVRVLPLRVSLFLGSRIGDLLFYLDARHRAIAYSNIKRALGKNLAPLELLRLTRGSYQGFGQNFIEIFLIPLITKEYIAKYVTIEGRDNIDRAFHKGKGVIFLAMHAGSWELSNVICSSLGFPFNFVIREQRHPRLNELLNSYRRLRGCKLIQRQNETRELIEALKRNESIGVTVDQGGRDGILVKFFGKDSSMATGALRLALKYDSVILPVYHTRINGPYAKVIIEPPFELKKTGGPDNDLRENLQRLMPIYERNILRYPREYMWSYKVWKYAQEKSILILSDGKAGHLRQSQAVAQLASRVLEEKGVKVNIETQEIKFKNGFSKCALAIGSLLSGKYSCQGCLICLKKSLEKNTYNSLIDKAPDLIISCGSSLGVINYLLSRENQARSVAVMRPGILGTRRFDLVIMPRHDNPPKRKNVLATEGALNLIDEEYLKSQALKLRLGGTSYIGLLIGGDSKYFTLNTDTVSEAIKQIKIISEKAGMDILVTTSRRTSKAVEDLVKAQLKDYPSTKLLVIANEKNIPEAVGGLLGLSSIVVSSAESISMISEAVSGNKYVFVFEADGLSKKHQRFLRNFAQNKYIYLTKAGQLASRIDEILRDKPPVNTLKDRQLVSEAIKKIL